MSEVPHITTEQASILYTNAEPMLKLSNELIDKHNARINQANAPQETYITAEEARKLGEGKAELGDTVEWVNPHGQKSTQLMYKDLTFDCVGIYTYRPKPLAQVSWKDVPVGVAVQEIQSKFKHTLLSADADGGAWIFSQRDKLPSYIVVEELELATEQPWIAVQGSLDEDGDIEQDFAIGLLIEVHPSKEKYRIIGVNVSEGYVMEMAK